MPAALEVRGVHKVYSGGVEALRDVDLSIDAGETLALVGESGCGKSTLLRMFNRLEDPTRGEVRIRGEAAARLDPIEVRRHTGYVQQDGGLLPHWTVGRNVELVPALLAWEAPRRRARADELLERVGLPPATYRDRYPIELSGGQRQRVAFARALAADPDVILLDEPFGALDALTRLDLQDAFLQLQHEIRKTLVLVTHDMAEAFRLGDRAAVMRQGRILQIGTPHELRTAPVDPYVAALVAHAVAGPA